MPPPANRPTPLPASDGPGAAPAAPAPARPRGRPRKTEEGRDDGNRRQLIIDGAARLFRTKGFDAASTRDIAAAAGMRSGSPFYHFESKNALLHAVVEEGLQRAVKSQQQVLSGLPASMAPPDRLAALVRHHFEILFGPEGDFIPVMLYEWRSLTPAQRTAIARLKAQYEAPWVPVLQALHDAGWLRTEPPLARLFILGALNWAVQWYQPGGRLSLDALAQQALALFLGPPAGGPASLSSLETRA